MQVAGFTKVGGLFEGCVPGGVVVAFVRVATAGAAHHHQAAAGLLHQPDQFGVASIGGQAGVPAHLDLRFHERVAQFLGVLQRHVEAVVHEKYLLQAVPLGDLRHFLNNLVDGANDAPRAFRRADVVRRRGIVETAQLGEDADAETGLGVLGHVQVIKARPFDKIGRAAHPVVHQLAVFAVQQPGHVAVVGFADFDAAGEIGETLTSVAGQTEVGLHVFKDLGGHDAERRAAAHDGRVGDGAHALNHALGDGQLPLWIHVAVIAEVAYGDPNQFGIEVSNRFFNLIQVVFAGKHQVNQLDLVAGPVNVAGHVGQADGDRLGAHTAHDAVVAVSGNQQDTHRKIPLGAAGLAALIVPIVHQAVRIDYAPPELSGSSISAAANLPSSSRAMSADAHSCRV